MSHSDNYEAAITRLRPMVAGDVQELTQLWVASWREAMPAIDFEARRAWIGTVLADPCHETIVAEVVGVVGFASTRGHVLHQLVVAPLAKGHGIARTLLEFVKTKTPEGLDLEVNQENARAVRFYVREGFLRAGASINPASGLPTWRMRWPGP